MTILHREDNIFPSIAILHIETVFSSNGNISFRENSIFQ